MAKLIVNPTSSSRREIGLPRSLLSIGRDPSNDLVLPDAMVSRRHAVIEYRGSQYYLRDCNSSNGSLVNGDRVSERGLRDGDLVAIGTARLLFREELEAEELGAKVVHHPSAPRLQCPSCKADYRKGDQFCRQCGAAVPSAGPPKAVCASCGTAVPLPAHFCSACGHKLPEEVPGEDVDTPAAARPAAAPPAAPEPAPAAAAPVPEEGLTGPADPPRHGRGSLAAEPLSPPAPLPPLPLSPPPRPLETLRRDPPRPVTAPVDRPSPRIDRSREPEWRPRPASPAAPAGFGPRLLAWLVDSAIVAAGQLVLLLPAVAYWWSREWPRDPGQVAFVPILSSLVWAALVTLAGAGYYIYFWGRRGATPGKQLLGLAVEGDDGSFPIGIGKAVARVLGYVLSGAVLGLGFLMIAFAGYGLHDRVAGTRVVRRARG
jgi:pSer/pThr/pTyr-binding forkhead associated (FHA) protein/uncharacterized RDD family membrane protein YckC